MTNKITKKAKINSNFNKRNNLFAKTPIWKAILIMVIPSMVMMFSFGSYFFFDNILSINLAADSYSNIGIVGMDSSDLIRIFMNGFGPINALMIACSLLLAIGTSTRVSINIGRGDIERAKNTLRTGVMSGVIFSILSVPILLFTAKPWIANQYQAFDTHSLKIIEEETFKYAWPLIATYPITMLGQIFSSLLRTEARNRQILIITILPILINLGFDAIFMGPVGLGIEGGAYATILANLVIFGLVFFFISKSEEKSILKLNILFGFKIKIIAIVGIILVGISPFLRNMAQSITVSVETNIFNEISSAIFIDDYSNNLDNLIKNDPNIAINHLRNALEILHKQIPSKDWINDIANPLGFGDNSSDINAMATKIVNDWDISQLNNPNSSPSMQVASSIIYRQSTSTMISIFSGSMPVFILFFPIMFSFAQAARPIAAFNYGAKNYNRVKQTYLWTVMYASIIAITTYFVVAWGISGMLIDLMNIHDDEILETKQLAIKTLRIIMLTMISFSFAVGGMTIFGSTDRILFSIIASFLRGFIIFWPAIFAFRELALHNPQNNLLIMWHIPVTALISSIIISLMVIKTLTQLSKKEQITLDERLEKVYAWRNKKLEMKKAKKQNKNLN